MASTPARDRLPYAAVRGADFTHDWVFERTDGSPEILGQVVAVRVELTPRDPTADVLNFVLGAEVEILGPNLVRIMVDGGDPEAWDATWRAPTYDGALFLGWADGLDECRLLFTVVAGHASEIRVEGSRTTVLRQVPAETRIVRAPPGRLTSIVPQIRLSALAYDDNTPVGTVIALATVDPPGAEVIYSLADDADGALVMVDGFKIAVAVQPDALAHPTLGITVEGAVTDGPTRLTSEFTLTLQPSPRGRLRFNDPANSGFLGAF